VSTVVPAKKVTGTTLADATRYEQTVQGRRLLFSSLEASKVNAPEPAMAQPFLDFSKALLVYLHDKRPVVSQASRITALRCLEASLRQWSKDSRPTAVNEDVLDTAVEMARNQVSAAVAYRVAGQLELISELMATKGFISLRQPWSHGVKKPGELGSRISEESLKAREEKLPSAAVLRALAGIFHQAREVPDVLVSSFTALMLCAPERINEILRLKRNCIVEGEGGFVGKLGLRWAGSKGAEDTTKWLPSEMVPVAQKAIAKLLELTAPAQKIAEWYTANPKSLYLHGDATYLRHVEILTASDLALILWDDSTNTDPAIAWAKAKAVPMQVLAKGRAGYRFEDVERAVIAMLPATFPYVPGAPELMCKDALAVMRVGDNNPRHKTSVYMFTCVDHGTITNALGKEGRTSIFVRFGYTEDDGTPITLKSHSLRHYLNMLAQMGGLSSAEIAIFSGRKDVSQNRVYDHMSVVVK